MTSYLQSKKSSSSIKTENKISNWIIYSMIFIAIIVSAIFYLFPFQKGIFPEEKVSIVYFADNITSSHTKIIDEFNELYKGKIKVIPVDIPTIKFTTNKRKELITRTLRSRNSRIDIFAIDQIWVPRFTKWAEPLDNFFTKKELDSVLPQALSTCIYNDTLYAVPFFIDVGVLFYRTDLIKKVPNSDQIISELKNGVEWNKLIELHKYFPNEYTYIFQGDAYEGLICNYLEILAAKGGSIYSSGKYEVYNPLATESAQELVDFIYKYKISPPSVTSFDESQSVEYALQNNIPFIREWPTVVKFSNLISKTTNKIDLLDVAPLPGFSNGHSTATIGGWNFILSRFSNVKKEAITFIKFVLSKNIQELNYNSGSYLPILKSFYTNAKMGDKYPQLKVYKTALDNAIHRPSDYNYTKISDILSYYLNKALKKEVTVKEALKQAQTKIDVTLNVFNQTK